MFGQVKKLLRHITCVAREYLISRCLRLIDPLQLKKKIKCILHAKKKTSIKSIKFTPVANGSIYKWNWLGNGGYLMILLRVHALDLINTHRLIWPSIALSAIMLSNYPFFVDCSQSVFFPALSHVLFVLEIEIERSALNCIFIS